jgi:hypothetical protein
MTSLLRSFPENTSFQRQMQLAELEYLLSSGADQTALAETMSVCRTDSILYQVHGLSWSGFS